MASGNRVRGLFSRRRAQSHAAKIPLQDLRTTEYALEAEAVAAAHGGVPNIPTTFRPTHTINPPRPRTIAAGYDPDLQILRIRFRPGASKKSPGGAVYDYYDVTEAEWNGLQHTISTGRYINNQLAAKDYARIY